MMTKLCYSRLEYKVLWKAPLLRMNLTELVQFVAYEEIPDYEEDEAPMLNSPDNIEPRANVGMNKSPRAALTIPV